MLILLVYGQPVILLLTRPRCVFIFELESLHAKRASVHGNQDIYAYLLPRAVKIEALTKRRTSHPLDPPITSGSHLIGRRQRL